MDTNSNRKLFGKSKYVLKILMRFVLIGLFSGGRKFTTEGTARLINGLSGLGKLGFSYPTLTCM